jgi:hypothetical protein
VFICGECSESWYERKIADQRAFAIHQRDLQAMLMDRPTHRPFIHAWDGIALFLIF